MSVRVRERSGPGVLRALAYADVRALVNALRTLRKRPGRALLWTGYAVFVFGFASLKVFGPHVPPPRTPPLWQLAIGDVWICGVTVVFGVILAGGRSRWLGVFTSRAEALFLTRARAAPALVATYLQLRVVASAVGQAGLRFAYLVVLGIPGGTSAAALGAQIVFFAACGAAIVSVALPRALASGPAVVAARVVGWSLAAFAAVPVLLDGLRLLHLPATASLVRAAPAWHPGVVLTMLISGDMRAVAIPIAVALLASAAFAAVARDAYPELYALSLANLEWRAKVARRRGGATAATTAADAPKVTRAVSSAEVRWRGAFAFVWADALTFSRRVSATTTAIVVALALAAGAGLAAVAVAVDDSLVFGLLFGIVPTIYITISSTTGVRLAPVLRLPLFWLGDVPLVARLAAWSLGPMWRDLALLALVLLGYVAVNRHPLLPLLAFAGGTGLLALTRGVGLAVFAMLPNALDQRGPAVVLRVLASMALILPPAGAGTIAGFLTHSVIAGVIAGSLLAVAESGVLIGFAAWRLAGRVDVLATA